MATTPNAKTDLLKKQQLESQNNEAAIVGGLAVIKATSAIELRRKQELHQIQDAVETEEAEAESVTPSPSENDKLMAEANKLGIYIGNIPVHLMGSFLALGSYYEFNVGSGFRLSSSTNDEATPLPLPSLALTNYVFAAFASDDTAALTPVVALTPAAAPKYFSGWAYRGLTNAAHFVGTAASYVAAVGSRVVTTVKSNVAALVPSPVRVAHVARHAAAPAALWVGTKMSNAYGSLFYQNPARLHGHQSPANVQAAQQSTQSPYWSSMFAPLNPFRGPQTTPQAQSSQRQPQPDNYFGY